MKSENISLENSLREKVRSVFKGLSPEDYTILRFFYEAGKGSKYEASKRLKKQVPRATVYRRIQVLKDKHFLTVIDSKQFVRGNLRSTVEVLTYTVKGLLATLGSDINPRKILEEAPKEVQFKSKLIQKITSYEKQLELFNELFNSLIDINEDLTDKKIDMNLLFFNFILKNPDYMANLINETFRSNNMKVTREFIKLAKIMQKELSS